MKPLSRISFNFPIYALDLLPHDRLAIAGGGGVMKSGIPNKCVLLSFHSQSASLSEQASVHLPDAVVALATSGTTLHAVIGPGVKNFSSTDTQLTPQSSFTHDLRVSATKHQSSIAVSEDSTILVVASEEGHVASVSLPRYEPLFSAHLHNQGVTDLAISQDGSLVATTGHDRTAYLWTSDSGHIVQTFKPVLPPAMRTHIRAIRFSVSQPHILFTVESNPSKGGWVAAWEKRSRTQATTFTPITSFRASAEPITACTVNRAGSLVAVSSSEGHVALLRWDGSIFSRLWSTEVKTDWISSPRPPHVLPITGMRFSESGEHLFTASADYTVAVWPVRRPTNWRRITHLIFWVLSLLVGLFAVLVADDNYLPRTVSYHRSRLQPHLEPHLSNLQGSVRPFFLDRQAQMQPYISEVQQAMGPHLQYAGNRIRPYTDKVREHRMRWQSIFQNTGNQLMGNREFKPSRQSHSNMKRHRKIRGTADDIKGNRETLRLGQNKPISSDSQSDHIEPKRQADHLKASKESIVEVDEHLDQVLSETQPASTSEDDNSHQVVGNHFTDSNRFTCRKSVSLDLFNPEGAATSEIEFSPPLRTDPNYLPNEETISSTRKERGSRRSPGHSDQQESLSFQDRATLSEGGIKQEEGHKGSLVPKKLPAVGNDSYKGDSQVCAPEPVVVERLHDEDTRTNYVIPDTAEVFDNEDAAEGSTTNRIAEGEEVVFDVNRTISLILSKSSHIVAASQPEHEASASWTGSEGPNTDKRSPKRGSP